MWRVTWMGFAALGCCAAAGWLVSQATAEKPTRVQAFATKDAPATKDQVDHVHQRQATASLPAWVSELTEIRRALGGGPLAGSLLDEFPTVEGDGAREFAEALRRISDESPARRPANVELAPISSSRDFASDDLPSDDAPSDAALAEALRNTAWLLDQKANQLEFARSYRRADRHRNLANRLRREARGLGGAAP